MIGCLKLYHDSITSLTKCKILRAMFHEEELEIHVGHNIVSLYIWNVKKEAIWQAAASFDSTNIMIGYGFGVIKDDAEKAANEALQKWVQS